MKSVGRFNDTNGTHGIETVSLSAEAVSKILTDIMNKTGYTNEYLIGSSVAVSGDTGDFYNDPSPTELYMTSFKLTPNTKFKINVNYTTKEAIYELRTVENIQNALGDHEYVGHGMNKWGDYNSTHTKVYEYQMQQPVFLKTTKDFKHHINTNKKYYEKKERK